MEIKVISKEKDSMELELKGADEMVLYPLVYQLLKDDNVLEAKYALGKLQTDPPKFYLKTKEGKPQTALKKAIKHVVSQLETAKKTFDKVTK